MRALVRKYPVNAVAEENNEVWFEPWRNADEQGRPYTLEGYRYAMCENVPDEIPEGENDPRMDVANYTVTEHTREIPSEEGSEKQSRTEKYWVAVYNPNQQQEIVQQQEEIQQPVQQDAGFSEN